MTNHAENRKTQLRPDRHDLEWELKERAIWELEMMSDEEIDQLWDETFVAS